MFRCKSASLAATILICVLPVGAQNAAGPAPGSQGPMLPVWLAAIHGAIDEHRTEANTEIASTYHVARSPADVIAHYREQFQKAEVQFNVSSDGLGTVIRCSEGKEYCVIQLREIDEGTSVKVSYSPEAGSAIGIVIPHETTSATPKDAAPKRAPDDPGTCYIEYEIDGSVHSAFITYRDATGRTQQKKVGVPYTDKFFVPLGAFIYLSAQKRVTTKIDNSYVRPREVVVDDGENGTVHVVIRVGGEVFREASSSKPFGIATASGIASDRR